MATDNLQITDVAEAQSDKVTTINLNTQALEDAFTENVALTVTGDFTLTDADFNGNVYLDLGGTPVGAFTLALPARKRFLIIDNGTGQTATIEVDPAGDGADGTTVDVEDGNIILVYADGANVTQVGAASGGGGGSLEVQDDAVQVLAAATVLNFTGSGVIVTDGGSGEAEIDIPGSAAASINDQTGTTYSPVLADAGDYIRLTNAAAITLTIEPDATTDFAVGTILTFEQGGAGVVTVSPGAGVTLNSRGSVFDIAGQHGVATCVKIAADTWTLTGDLT